MDGGGPDCGRTNRGIISVKSGKATAATAKKESNVQWWSLLVTGYPALVTGAKNLIFCAPGLVRWLVSGFDDRLIACLFIVILFELGSKNGDRGGFQRNVALRLKDHDMVGR